MKRTIILAVAVVVAFTSIFTVVSCTKKIPGTQCYRCERYQLDYALIYTQYDKPRTLVAIDTVCNMNSGRIKMYEKDHNRLDTIYRGTNNDTIILRQHSSICDIE